MISVQTTKKKIKAQFPKFVRYIHFVVFSGRNSLRYLLCGQIKKALIIFYVLWIVANNAIVRFLPIKKIKKKKCLNCLLEDLYFLPYYYVDCFRENVVCPSCGIIDRYRTLLALKPQIRSFCSFSNDRVNKILDIAPMHFSGDLLRKIFKNAAVTSFDLNNQSADVRGDIQQMPFENSSFDFILCYEVLDYIPNDAKALDEMFRVLSDGGVVLLRVGFDFSQETEEFANPNPDDSFHIRKYGKDLVQRLIKPGFVLSIINPSEYLMSEQIKRFALDSENFFVLKKESKTHA